MRPLYKGVLLAVLHLVIVCSLGAKLLYDRATRPRVWTPAAPYDPDLPIRGRYVSLQLEVHSADIQPAIPPQDAPGLWRWRQVPVVLQMEQDRLVARRDPQSGEADAYRLDRNAIFFRPGLDGKLTAVLGAPVLFFIPEHIPDPSRREAGEELWVEVTLPKKGPPRPVRLGVKKGDVLTPLELN